MLETKNLSDRLIQLVNNELADNRFQLEESMEKKIRETVHMAFREGYADCLNDLEQGFIKLPNEF